MGRVPNPKGRKAERAAINAVVSLFERHGHIVHRIESGNDVGEDLLLSFVEDDETTGDTIAIQVKGGVSYRASGGYRVRVGGNEKSWLTTNVPVVCIVFDTEEENLYWCNASRQLRDSPGARKGVKEGKKRSVQVSKESILNDESIRSFGLKMCGYIHDVSIAHVLGKISGIKFDTTDYLSYFVNQAGEQLIFHQERGVPYATLLHEDFDWDPVDFFPDEITGEQRARAMGVSTLEDMARLTGYKIPEGLADDALNMSAAEMLDKMPVVGGRLIVDKNEMSWLESCAEGSKFWRPESR
ncbi:DUF4365 domain-containing protein [Saccharopolyspora sp. K220]|uniref:DUF4365 domain-containing protein n=1 Tax=Saccharopolyspora soli TaxID=2926618 RepID=UPI001F595F71|nr:DUF4365 domain-containing protein [Saccharopolyspora soli]MCI2423426.1 DUF4365 domain-containing protein [Saccharopolyspora soli]